MSLESMDEFRGDPFIDVPEWENDLLDELLRDPELSRPKSERKPQQKAVPEGGKGQGKKDMESQPGRPARAAMEGDSVLTSPQ